MNAFAPLSLPASNTTGLETGADGRGGFAPCWLDRALEAKLRFHSERERRRLLDSIVAEGGRDPDIRWSARCASDGCEASLSELIDLLSEGEPAWAVEAARARVGRERVL